MPIVTRFDIEEEPDAEGSETGVTGTPPQPIDDDVGYGKPPSAYKFKPGVSGNPRGRPRKKKRKYQPPAIKLPGLLGELINLLETERTVTRNGKRSKVTNLSIAAEHLLRDLFGTPLDRMRVVKLLIANGHMQILEQMDDIRAAMTEQQDDIPLDVLQLIEEMAYKYLDEPKE